MATGRAIDFSGLLAETHRTFAGRGWLMDCLADFVRSPGGPRSLVILGDPGAGKTAVLARLARDLGAAHFFCGRTDGVAAERGGGWCEPVRCAETLGTQLTQAYGEAIMDWSRFGIDQTIRVGGVHVSAEVDHVAGRLTLAELGVLDAIPRPPDRPTHRLRAIVGDVAPGGSVVGMNIQQLTLDPMLALQELFLGPLRRAAAKTDKPVVVVLDALDEWDRFACPIDALELAARSELPDNVKLVASARPSYADRLPPNALVVDISDPSAQARLDDDIADLADRLTARKSIDLAPNLRADLVRRASGNFLLATYLLEAIDPDEPKASLERLPPGLEAFYACELADLSDQLAREGLRDGLAPLLSVICSAREPLSAAAAARAVGSSADAVSDLLGRLRAFIRPRLFGAETGYAAFHLSFSDFVLSGRAGFGLDPVSGHRRIARALAPAPHEAWASASDYAVRHLLLHAAAADTLDSSQCTAQLVSDAGYLAERVARLGFEALEADLRHAETLGVAPRGLAAMIGELALRSHLDRAAAIVPAQGLAVAAASVGAPQLALGFAGLASDAVVARPAWCVGLQGAQIALGGFRSPGKVKDATLTAGDLLTLTKQGAVEIWDVRRRQQLASLEVGPDADCAVLEPNGSHVWVGLSPIRGASVLRRCSVPGGQVVGDLALDQTISCLAISDDGRWVAVGTRRGRVILLDAASLKAVASRDVGSIIEALRFDAGRLAALAQDRKAVAWRVPGLELEGVALAPRVRAAHRFADRTDGLAFDGSSGLAIVGGVDGSLTELDLSGAAEPRMLARLTGWVDHLALLPHDRLVAGDSTGRLHFFDRSGVRPAMSLRAHAAQIAMVAASENPNIILSLSQDGELRSWRPPRANELETAGHETSVVDLAFGADLGLLSLGEEGSIIHWRPDGAVAQRAFLDPEAFTTLRLSPDLASLIIAQGNKLRRQPLAGASEEVLRATPWARDIADKCSALFAAMETHIAVTSDGALAIGTVTPDAEVWSFGPDHVRLRFEGERPAGRGALSVDGALLITTADGRFVLRALEPGHPHPRREIPWGTRLLCAPFWTGQGMVIALSDGPEVQILDSGTLEVCAVWTMTGDTPAFAAASPDGGRLAVFGEQGVVEFRGADGARLGAFVVRPPATAAAFSPDGRRLALGDRGGGLQVYDLTLRADHAS